MASRRLRRADTGGFSCADLPTVSMSHVLRKRRMFERPSTFSGFCVGSVRFRHTLYRQRRLFR